jgi:hypothetical protein
MKEIPLTRGYVALVDDEDYERLAQYKWHANASRRVIYAVRCGWANGRTIHIQMHRDILRLEPGDPRRGDHINHDGLDNQRINLRVCSVAENTRNSRKPRRGLTSSGFKGVYKQAGKIYASIHAGGRRNFLGVFESEIDAAVAYDKAARKHFGEFACCNFPEKKAVQSALLDVTAKRA